MLWLFLLASNQYHQVQSFLQYNKNPGTTGKWFYFLIGFKEKGARKGEWYLIEKLMGLEERVSEWPGSGTGTTWQGVAVVVVAVLLREPIGVSKGSGAIEMLLLLLLLVLLEEYGRRYGLFPNRVVIKLLLLSAHRRWRWPPLAGSQTLLLRIGGCRCLRLQESAKVTHYWSCIVGGGACKGRLYIKKRKVFFLWGSV